MSTNPNYNPYITVDYVAKAGGVNVMMGDGSVRFVSSGVGTVRSQLFTFQLDMGSDGISPIGIDQLLRAEIITGSGDRRALANAILRKMGFTALIDSREFGMLLPAVQGLRAVSRNRVSTIGALQVLSAEPVSSPQDRNVLAGQECLVFFLGGVPGRQSAFDPNFQGGVFVATR